MKKTARLVLSTLGILTILFLYQNCGTKGEIFGQCTTEACASTSESLFLDTSDGPNGYASGTPLTVGKIDGQELSNSTLDYKNIDFEGSCGPGPSSRHVIRWNITCTNPADCQALSPRRGTRLCYGGRFQIKEYIRGISIPVGATQTGFGRYSVKMEIVGLDPYYNDIPGDSNARAEFPLNFAKTIQAPTLLSFGGDINYSLPIVPISGDLLYQGLCDHSTTSSSENIMTLKFALANTGFTAGGGIAANDINCTARDGSGMGSAERTGYFDRNIAGITPGGLVSPGFSECTNCLENIFSRLLEFTLSQTDLIGSQSISVKNKKLFQLKSNDLYYGKGWSVETLREVAKRINKTLNFQVTTDTSISGTDYTRLNTLMRAGGSANYDDDTSGVQESESLRRYVLYKIGETEGPHRFLSTDYSLQVFGNSSSFRSKMKSIAAGASFCESARSSGLITGSGVDGDIELHRIALCLTRYFYYGLHNTSNDVAKRLTLEGLNYTGASTCRFQGMPDGSVAASNAPDKLCIKVKEFLSNYSGPASNENPKNPNPANTNNKLTSLKTKFLGGAAIASISTDDVKFKFFVNAVVQMYVNSIMAEISRHTSGGVANSFFMEDVLDEIYQRSLENHAAYYEGSGSYNYATKIALYNLLSPNEVNYSGGGNNFSAYSSRREAGSTGATGSLDCRIVTTTETQCNP